MNNFNKILREMVMMKQDKPPIMILSNPKRKELDSLEDFSEVHDLSIENWIDSLPSTEWRFIYEVLGEEWFVWSGFQMHNDIMKRFKLPEVSSVLGYVRKVRDKYKVEIFNFDASYENRELALEKIKAYMKKNGIKGTVWTEGY